MEHRYTESWTNKDQTQQAATPEPTIDPAVLARRPIRPMRSRRTAPASPFTTRRPAAPTPQLSTSVSPPQEESPSPYAAVPTPAYDTVVGSSQVPTSLPTNAVTSTSSGTNPVSPPYIPATVRERASGFCLPSRHNPPDLAPAADYLKAANLVFPSRSSPRHSKTDPAAISLSAQLDAVQAAKARSPATMIGQGARESARKVEERMKELAEERDCEKKRGETLQLQVAELQEELQRLKAQQVEEKAKSPKPESQSSELLEEQLREAKEEVARQLAAGTALEERAIAAEVEAESLHDYLGSEREDRSLEAKKAAQEIAQLRQSTEDAVAARDRLQQEHDVVSADRNHLREQLESAKNLSASWEGQYRAAEGRLSTSESGFRHIRTQLETELGNVTSLVTSQRAVIEQKDGEIMQLRQAFDAELKSRVEGEVKQLVEMKEESLSKQVAGYKAKVAEDFEKFKAEFAREADIVWSRRLEEANLAKQEAEGKVTAKDLVVNDLRKAASRQRVVLSALQDDHSKEVTILKNALRDAVAPKASPKSVSPLAPTCRTLAAEEPRKVESVERLLFKVEALEAQVKDAKLDAQIAKEYQRLDFKKLQVERRQSRQAQLAVARLEERVHTLESSNREKTETLREARESYDKLQEETRTRKVLIETLQSELERTKGDFERVNTSLSEHANGHAALKVNFSQVEQERHDLKIKLASVSQELRVHKQLLKIQSRAPTTTAGGADEIIFEEDLPLTSTIQAPLRSSRTAFDEGLERLLGDDSPLPPRSAGPAVSVLRPIFVMVATQTDDSLAAPPRVSEYHTATTQTESTDSVTEVPVPAVSRSITSRWLARIKSIDSRILFAVLLLFSMYVSFRAGANFDEYYRNQIRNLPEGYSLRHQTLLEALLPHQGRFSMQWFHRQWLLLLNWFFEEILGDIPMDPLRL
ncbi:hypothetical protein ACMFMG_006401 [Clarireedia jacksonii]